MACINHSAIGVARRYIKSICWKVQTADEARNLPIDVNDEVYVDGDRYLAMDYLTATDEGLRLVYWSEVDRGPQHASDYIEIWSHSRDWS